MAINVRNIYFLFLDPVAVYNPLERPLLSNTDDDNQGEQHLPDDSVECWLFRFWFGFLILSSNKMVLVFTRPIGITFHEPQVDPFSRIHANFFSKFTHLRNLFSSFTQFFFRVSRKPVFWKIENQFRNLHKFGNRGENSRYHVKNRADSRIHVIT